MNPLFRIGIMFVLSAVGTALAAPPNVLFIISDDLTAEALSCYGNIQCKTPNIDKLASQGMRFTRAYTQYPVCGPARAAMMSGMYPSVIGVLDNKEADQFTDHLGPRPSLAQHFKDNGYYTARVSKIYHMRIPGDITAGVDGPDHIGSWTERFNCPAPEWHSSGAKEQLTNEELVFDPEQHYAGGFGTAFYVVKGDTDGAEQPDVQAADKAIELLKAHRSGSFFLAVGLVRPHVPLVAPASYFEPYPPEAMQLPPQMPGDEEDLPKYSRMKTSTSSGLDSVEKKQKVLSAYYASVTFMDAQAGRILSALDELGLRENTVVVFTSDHGYHLGEHEQWQKMSLHEESVRIPLIVDAPGRAPGESQSLAQMIDVYPTLAALAGLPVPPHVQGKSLTPILDDPTATVHDAVYSSTKEDQLLTTHRWSYARYRDGSEELYDLEKDPRQFFNLAAVEAYRGVLESMRAKLDAKVAEIGG